LSPLHSLKPLKDVGPGALVTAAFIGPGTVTVCTLAGASFGYELIWALLFATAATIVFQEMAGRLGTIAQKGLGEALRASFARSAWRWPLYLLIVLALYAGNAAYEAGNLSGAALGVEALIGSPSAFRASVLSIASVAALALWRGSYRQLERLLLGLVLFMGVAFIGTFVVSRPDLAAFARGLLIPKVSSASLITVIALIGTTVVPYNLFLHASAAKAKWSGAGDLSAVLSRYLLGAGLLAAGLSSSLTAPLATAYAVTEVFSPDPSNRATVFRAVALSVLIIGVGFAMTGIEPITIILTAQFANGLLLPIIAAFLLYAVNDRKILGEHVNGTLANSLGAAVFLISLALGARLVLRSLGVF
jgi:Mn2+/Fe2+ NRAMP family transporter